jgi:hypothetical protein
VLVLDSVMIPLPSETELGRAEADWAGVKFALIVGSLTVMERSTASLETPSSTCS